MLDEAVRRRRSAFLRKNDENANFQMLLLRKNPVTKLQSKTCTVCVRSDWLGRLVRTRSHSEV